MAKVKVLFARFPGNHSENPDCTDWLVRTVIKAKADPRIESVMSWYKSDTPITMTRNQAVEVAKEKGADFIVMVDSDMYPDDLLGEDPKAVPFWDLAFNFLMKHHGPAMIAVPYCGPPPIENVYIFEWARYQSDHPNPDLHIAQFAREAVIDKHGIEEVAALPTGLCMFHTSALDKLKPPYFYYEWKDDRAMEKASTEDVTFTRDLAFAGVPIYVAWDCWAGHWKMKKVRKPGRISVDAVSARYSEAAMRKAREELQKSGGICPCCEAPVRKSGPEPGIQVAVPLNVSPNKVLVVPEFGTRTTCATVRAVDQAREAIASSRIHTEPDRTEVLV